MLKKSKKVIATLVAAVFMAATAAPAFAVDSPSAYANGTASIGAAGSASSAQMDDTAQTTSQVIEYAYVESATVSSTGQQNVAVGLIDQSAVVESATLTYCQKETGQTFTAPLTKANAGSMLFALDTHTGEGDYAITSLLYTLQGTSYTVRFADEGIQASFTISESAQASVIAEEDEPGSSEPDISVQALTEEGGAYQAGSIQQALAETQTGRSAPRTRSANGNLKVYVDAGHDKKHYGARDKVFEEEYTLKIAKACRDELQKYKGVEVRMSREGEDCPYPETGSDSDLCVRKRVEDANNWGADLYVSIHLNSGDKNKTANGAEVYISNYSKYTSDSAALADKILNELSSLGLDNRGWKFDADDGDHGTYPDGHLQDDFYVIRGSVLDGHPGILVEHAFVTNAYDAGIITSRYADMGRADAKAIAAYYGLQPDTQKALVISQGNHKVGGTVILQADGGYLAPDTTQYRFVAYDGSSWKNLNDWSSTPFLYWTPNQAGDYILGVEGRTSSGQVTQYIRWEYYSASGCPLVIGQGNHKVGGTVILQADGGYLAPDTTQYRFVAYDGSSWKNLNDWSSTPFLYWTPNQAGDYILGVEGRSSSGQVTQYIRWEYYGASGCPLVIGQGNHKVGGTVILQADSGYLAPDTTQYRFVAYDGSSWKNLNDWSSTPFLYWTPTWEGDYIFGVEGRSSNGTITQYIRWEYYSASGLPFIVRPETGASVGNSLILQADSGYLLPGTSSYRFIMYNEIGWHSLSNWSTTPFTYWTPANLGNYILGLEGADQSGRVTQYINWTPYSISDFPIMGNAPVTADQMVRMYQAKKYTYDRFPKYSNGTYDGALSKGGAPSIRDFCNIIVDEAKAEGVRADVVFCQAMKETGWLQFGGDVKPNQYNFGGLGATGGVNGNGFDSVRIGIRAQVQHLKAYGSTAPLNQACVDGRFDLVARGIAPTVTGLTNKWASSSDYGASIVKMISELHTF